MSLTSEDLAEIRYQVKYHAGCTSEPCGSTICETQRHRADLLAHIDEQAEAIQRVRDLLIPSFYSRAEANQLLNKIQSSLNDGGQE